MLDRTVAPPHVQSSDFDLIHPQQKKLPNGVDLFFVNGGSQNVLKIELIFRAGKWFESTAGASYFTAHLVSKGTRDKSSFDIAQLFDLYGAHLEVNAGLDLVSVSLYSLTKKLKPVLDLLMEVVQFPVFPEKEIDQTKTIYIQNLKVNQEKTSFLASVQFRKNLFGEDHPYGEELQEEDVKKLLRGDLETHFVNHFKDVGVFVSGKIDPETENLITRTFSTWQKVTSLQRSWNTVEQKATHERVEKAESVQSSIRMGRRSILRTHPDYVDAVFASHILGGYFGSRLMKNIREEKGLTYGISSSIHPLQNSSYLVIGADVNKENVEITFDEIRKELKRLRSEKISEDELETARNHFIGSLQSEITTPFAHADKIKTIYLFGLPFDFYQQMIRGIKRIDAGKILETGEKYLNEETFLEVSVG